MRPSLKAWLFAVCFSLFGIASAVLAAPESEFVFPHVIFYAVLIVNSFFSIRLFSSIQPRSALQTFADLILLLAYVALAFSIGRPVAFSFFALSVFVAAPPKYALMLGMVPHDRLLRRKILLDLAGTALCAAVLGGTLLGYELASAWLLAIVFALANAHLLLIRPMYRIYDTIV